MTQVTIISGPLGVPSKGCPPHHSLLPLPQLSSLLLLAQSSPLAWPTSPAQYPSPPRLLESLHTTWPNMPSSFPGVMGFVHEAVFAWNIPTLLTLLRSCFWSFISQHSVVLSLLGS